VDVSEPACDNCGGHEIELGITLQYPGVRDRPEVKSTEGQWYRCKKCGRRWFVPAGLM
jgi:predicted RNA-binding Zn-ribbon protein involved in translation (DUF1610 family)